MTTTHYQQSSVVFGHLRILAFIAMSRIAGGGVPDTSGAAGNGSSVGSGKWSSFGCDGFVSVHDEVE
jgi:hypothetical protein